MWINVIPDDKMTKAELLEALEMAYYYLDQGNEGEYRARIRVILKELIKRLT